MHLSRQLPSYPLYMLLMPNHGVTPDWWPDRPKPQPDAVPPEPAPPPPKH